MALLNYNEIKPRTTILYDGEPYEVVASQIGSKGGYKAVNVAKLKHMVSGKVVEITFHQSERVAEAEITYKDAKFMYKDNKNLYWFSDPNDPKNRFNLSEAAIGTPAKFMKPNSIIETAIFDEKIIGVHLPIKVELKVVEAPPAVKGDTSTNATKQVTLESGAIINAPLFITEKDIAIVNTETGEYVGRVTK